jgi:hypothetical protein
MFGSVTLFLHFLDQLGPLLNGRCVHWQIRSFGLRLASNLARERLMKSASTVEGPWDVLRKRQKIFDLPAHIIHVPAALVTIIDPPNLVQG